MGRTIVSLLLFVFLAAPALAQAPVRTETLTPPRGAPPTRGAQPNATLPEIVRDPAKLPEPVRAMRERILAAARTGDAVAGTGDAVAVTEGNGVGVASRVGEAVLSRVANFTPKTSPKAKTKSPSLTHLISRPEIISIWLYYSMFCQNDFCLII